MKALHTVVYAVLLSIAIAPLSAETWFVRADGGTRYSAKMHDGQCDGKADAAYPGKGANQHCAFNDVRWMWMDGSYGNSQWVMKGGDTLVIRGCAASRSQQNPDAPHCRIGWDKATGPTAQSFWCAGVSSDCGMPPPPPGRAPQHTRILGACAYGTYTCNSVVSYPYKSNLTQLFGGFGVGAVIWLSGSSYLDIEGLEVTSHNGACTRVGSPQYPVGCSTFPPANSDYATSGIVTTNSTANITLQDVYIHGLTGSGMLGPIGGPFTLTRVFIGFNAFAGWNFDDGHSTPDGPGSSIAATYVTMEGNGCLEEYPITHPAFPALSCWDDSSGGFGDAWSGQNTKLDSLVCDHCVMAYNTKDGFIGPHTLVHSLKITHSQSYGNMGQQWKWGTDAGSTTIFENNLTVGNCRRMSEAIPGAPAGYNRHLSDFCRAAGDIVSFITAANSTVLFANNTFAGYSATTFDISCAGGGQCGSAHIRFRNDIVSGFADAKSGSIEPPGLFYFGDPSVKVQSDHDIFYNLRTRPCPLVGHSDLICQSPTFANQPPLTIKSEAQLDHFDFRPAPGSPAIGHGQAIEGVTADFFGTPRPNPPSIGAAEPAK